MTMRHTLISEMYKMRLRLQVTVVCRARVRVRVKLFSLERRDPTIGAATSDPPPPHPPISLNKILQKISSRRHSSRDSSRARSKGEESRAKNLRRRSEGVGGVGGVGGGQEVAAPIEVTVCEKNHSRLHRSELLSC